MVSESMFLTGRMLLISADHRPIVSKESRKFNDVPQQCNDTDTVIPGSCEEGSSRESRNFQVYTTRQEQRPVVCSSAEKRWLMKWLLRCSSNSSLSPHHRITNKLSSPGALHVGLCPPPLPLSPTHRPLTAIFQENRVSPCTPLSPLPAALKQKLQRRMAWSFLRRDTLPSLNQQSQHTDKNPDHLPQNQGKSLTEHHTFLIH